MVGPVKRIAALALPLPLMLLIAFACGFFQSPTTPSEVTEAFITACNNGNYTRARGFVAAERAEELSGEEFRRRLNVQCQDLSKSGRLRKIEIIGENVSEVEAAVEVFLTYRDGTSGEWVQELLNQGGRWKVVLTTT